MQTMLANVSEGKITQSEQRKKHEENITKLFIGPLKINSNVFAGRLKNKKGLPKALNK